MDACLVKRSTSHARHVILGPKYHKARIQLHNAWGCGLGSAFALHPYPRFLTDIIRTRAHGRMRVIFPIKHAVRSATRLSIDRQREEKGRIMVQGRGRPVRGTWALDAEMGKIPRGGIHWQYDCGKFNAGTATKAEVNLLNELRIDDMRSRARLDCNEYRVSRPARARAGL
jgi:hypothetical protein